MRKDYARFVELSNKGAKELGFADTGAMWRSKYDMPPDAFTKELDRLWDQVRPLYLEAARLRAAEAAREVRRRRAGERADSGAPARQHVGAGLVEHLPARRAAERRSRLLADRHPQEAQAMPALEMVRIGERFYTSLGFAPLPKTFWERSLFVRPKDREVVCHASAWDIDYDDDLRIKMCIEPTAEDFTTIHHELGHNFYQRAYKQAAGPLPRQRQRRLPRGDRRHHRAVGHAGVPGEDRPARQGARHVARHRAADEQGAREDRVPAVRPAHRSSGAGTCSPAR